MHNLTIADVENALSLADFDAADAQRRMAPQPRAMQRSSRRTGEPRRASVLLLLYPHADGLALVLIRRTENADDVHSGQISLPGGAQEPGESPVANALREAHEELGVSPGDVSLLGELSSLYIPPSDFLVQPVVGSVDQPPTWSLQASEVAQVLEVPLDWLFDPDRKVTEDWNLNGYALRVPWYSFHNRKVWGATAIILSEFEQRLRHVCGQTAP